MRKQQQVWENEHAESKAIPGLASSEPGGGVVWFVEFLRKKGISSGSAIDIGSGKGRNSIYLAEQGFSVYAIDYIQSALDLLRDNAKHNNVTSSVHTIKGEIDKQWPFTDNFFDIAIDSYSSIDIETKRGREKYKKELLRTLKPKGYALITVVSTADEWEKELIANHPGPEKNSTIWPQTGKFQKDYDEEELRDFYRDFDILELKLVEKSAFRLGKQYLAKNWWCILQK